MTDVPEADHMVLGRCAACRRAVLALRRSDGSDLAVAHLTDEATAGLAADLATIALERAGLTTRVCAPTDRPQAPKVH